MRIQVFAKINSKKIFFFRNLSEGFTVIFDEVHRIGNASLTLKTGTDEFPHLKILATGSSTLAATKKFHDSLTGRKTQLFFPPVLWNECLNDFGIPDLDQRLLNGGLPEFLITENKREEFCSEWIDSIKDPYKLLIGELEVEFGSVF